MTRRICLFATTSALLAFGALAGPKVSIIGDSYSTYQSWGATYYPALDVYDISKQWWSQVIAGIDGASLEVNASWSGARMSGLDTDDGATTFSSFLCRARLIGNPDIIFVCGAMNDDWNGVSTAVLERDVELMFNDLDRNHPLAKKFFVLNAENEGGRPGLKPATRQCILGLCSRHYYPVVDLNGVLVVGSADYQSDHPTAQGMTKIANAVLAKYADCEQNGYPARADAAATVDADGLFTADDTTYTCEMVGDEYVVTFTNITHAITFTPLVPIDISRILVVGGGGAGGFTIGGGGGGGEVRDLDFGELGLDADESATIIVGQGGYEPLTKAKAAGETDKCTWGYNHGEGGTSSITLAGTTYAALGGGAGGSWHAEKGSDGANGGGGAGTKDEPRKGGASVNGGHSGGDVYAVGDYYSRSPGGGGGAGGDGQTPTSETVAGDGGAGVSSNITGENLIYGAGGGGGIGNSTVTPGAGGTNAGSGASANNAKGGSAVDGFGGGGGGGGYDGSLGYAGGNGGNGTVIIRFSESVVEQTPAPRVGFRGVAATDHTSANFSWRFTSKGDAPEDATLVACDVYGVCSNATVRPTTNRLATVESAAPAVYGAVFAHLAPGTDYDGAVFAVSRYELAGGETVEYVSETKTFSFSTVAETSFDQQFTELAYLESTGTQYIKTGVTPSADLRIAGKYGHLEQGTLTGFKLVTIFGYFLSENDGLCLWTDSGGNWVLSFNNPSILRTKKMTDEIYDFETHGASMTVDGVEYASSAAYSCSQTPDLPLFAFFAPNNGGYTTCGSKVRLYSFKIWKGDELVRDFVPAEETSTGAVGMYDLVTWKFFGNDGTGVFNAGDAVEAGRLAKTFALDGETYDGGTLVASLSQRGGAAGEVMMCAGSEYGGDDLSAWSETRSVGAFAEGENAMAAVVTDLPAGTVYVRFYSVAEKAWSRTIYLPGTEIASTPAPIVTDPVVKSVTPGLARFTTCVAFLGTGATSCDVFSVCTLDGVVVTNEVARNVTDSSELAFTISPLRPGHDYAVRCFADNGAELGVGSSEEVGFTTPQENLGNLEYMEVSHLESTGTQYVLTDVTPSADMRIAGKVVYLQQSGLTDSKWTTFFGYFESTSDGFCLWVDDGSKKFNFNNPSILNGPVCEAGTVLEFETSGASMTVNDVEYESSASYYCSLSTNMPLFAFHARAHRGYTTCSSKVRLHSFKIWKGEALVRDFVPVKRNSTGKAGLYDLVSGAFFGNAGTGDFLYGSAVSEPRITPSLAATDLRYDGSTLSLGLTRAGAAAGEVFACFGPQYGGDDTNDWEHCVLAGRFAAGETAAELLVNGVGSETAYVRFFSVADNGWSPSVFMADVEVAERMPPTLTRPVATAVGAGSAAFSAALDYLGTGGTQCDIFSVLTAGGESRTNVVAKGVAECGALEFSFAPLRPGCAYSVFCFASNDVGTAGASAPVAFTAAELGTVSSVPADLTEVEYLESSGSQYVLTGVHPSDDLRIAGKVEYLQQSGLTDGKWTTFFGYFSSASDGYCLWVDDGTKEFSFNDPSILRGPKCTPGTVLEFETSGASMTVNGTRYSSSAAYNCSKSPDLPLFAFFAPNNGGYVTCNSKARIYSFRIYVGDELVRDFRPVVDRNGVACMYDTVAGEFHYNAGIGAFAVGPVKSGAFHVAGAPENFGEAHPSYGAHYDVADGTTFECAAPPPTQVGTMTAVCTGWKLLERGDGGEWAEIARGDEPSVVCTHSASATRQLVWQFAVRDVAAVEAPVATSVGVGGAAFDVAVRGIGLTAESATLKLACGYSEAALVSTNLVAAGVGNRGTFHAVVNGLLPNRTYVVKAVLENSDGEVVASGTTDFVTKALPAAEKLPAGFAKLACLESDGRQRIDTGVAPGPDTAVEFAFRTLAYQNDTTLFGCAEWNVQQYLFIEQNSGGTPYFRFYDNQKNVAPFTADTDYAFAISASGGAELKSGNVVAGAAALDLTVRNASSHLNLFDVANGGHGGAYRLYGFKIVKGGELVRDFAPALRADGVAGLVDLVNGTFYTTVTSTPFPAPSGRAIFSAEATDEGLALTFQSGAAAELFCASSADCGADDASDWSAVESRGKVGAEETAKTIDLPSGWGESVFYAKCFTVVGGVTNWGPVVVWRDPSLPTVEGVSADGLGGDQIVVTGTLGAPVGDGCALKVYVGTDPSALDVVWAEMDGSTVTAEGDFAFTLHEQDATSPLAFRPDTTYYLAVEADVDGRISRSETVAVTTRGLSAIGSVSTKVSRRVVTFNGSLTKTGAGGSAAVTLWCGDTNNAEAFVQAEGPIFVTSTDAFSITHDFGDFERTHYWQFRVVNVTAGGEDLETRSAVGSVKTLDVTTYTWRADVTSGDWCDSANWTDNAGGDCLGYPQFESATAVFPAGTKATVTLSRALTVNKVDLNAAGLDLVFTGGKANRLTTPNLVLGKLEDGALRNSRIVVDNAAVTAKSNHMYLGNGSELTFRNGADFLAEQNLYTQLDLRADPSIVVTNRVNVLSGATFTTQNGIGLSGGTVFTVDDAKLTFKNIFFNEHIGGGWLRIAGRHPVVKGSDMFRTGGNAKDNKIGGLVFTVPAGGYQEVPLKYTSGTERRFGGASEGPIYEPMMVYVDPKSPAYTRGKSGFHTNALVQCTKAIAVENVAFGSLERRNRKTGTFLYSRTDAPEWEPAAGFTKDDKPLMIGVALKTVPSMMIQVR